MLFLFPQFFFVNFIDKHDLTLARMHGDSNSRIPEINNIPQARRILKRNTQNDMLLYSSA